MIAMKEVKDSRDGKTVKSFHQLPTPPETDIFFPHSTALEIPDKKEKKESADCFLFQHFPKTKDQLRFVSISWSVFITFLFYNNNE